MLLHEIINKNKIILNILKDKKLARNNSYNFLLINDDKININEDEDEYNNDTMNDLDYDKQEINKNYEDNIDPEILLDEEYLLQTRSIVRNISGNQPFWKPISQPAIYAINFFVNASGNAVAIYRYGTAFSFLSVSASLIYTGTCNYIGNNARSGYPIGNIYSGNQTAIKNFNAIGNTQNSFQYGNILGSGVAFGGTIYAIAQDNNGNIYIGGNFLIEVPPIGGIPQQGIGGLAKWNGTSWSAIGNPSTNTFFLNGRSAVYSIVIDGTNIYVGGYFNYINDTEQTLANKAASFAVWNGAFWSNGDIGVYDDFNASGSIYAMKKYKNLLFIGGTISKVGTVSSSPIFTLLNCRNIFQLNIPISGGIGRVNGGLSSSVYSIDVDTAGNLYIGGSFVAAYQTTSITSNISAFKIVRSTLNTNGTRRWQALITRVTINRVTRSFNGVGIKGAVYAVAINPKKTNEIWIGGTFLETFFGLDSRRRPIRNARLNGAFISSFLWQTDFRWIKQPYVITNVGT
jgi:hypothetical protein